MSKNQLRSSEEPQRGGFANRRGLNVTRAVERYKSDRTSLAQLNITTLTPKIPPRGASMYTEITPRPKGEKNTTWSTFLTNAGLTPDPSVTQTVLIWEDSQLIATGSRQANILKCIAVDSAHRGEDLTATLLTALREEAFREGHRHLFLYTKPENQYLFSSLFFYPVARTDKVLLMENKKGGIDSFIESLPLRFPKTTDQSTPIIGAAVMNCNPFTKGHRYLIETAAGECDHLYVFVLSEEQSDFTASDRLEMVRLGTGNLPNVTVYPTGPYLISSATFPTYFLKERDNAEQVHCLLDIQIFTTYFVPKFGITHRFVGTEPLSPLTARYNEALKANLPEKGVAVREIPRLTIDGDLSGLASEPISASMVRAFIDAGNPEAIRPLVPRSTFEYLQANGLLINTKNQ